MRELRRILVLLSAVAFLFAPGAHGQDDSPSLGDAARQARLQKQKDARAKDVPAKDTQAKESATKDTPAKGATAKGTPSSKAAHVFTNEEIPEHVGPTGTSAAGYRGQQGTYQQPSSDDGKVSAAGWTAQILSVKNYIASLESNVKGVEESIRYAGGNCVANCVQWNERQQQKQQQVESMKSQLEEQQKHLEDMQENARRQGYGSSVYDP